MIFDDIVRKNSLGAKKAINKFVEENDLIL